MLPTATAVVADVLDIIKNIDKKQKFIWTEDVNTNVIDFAETKTAFFVRVAGSAEKINDIFGKVTFVDSIDGENAFVTEIVTEKAFTEMINNAEQNGVKIISYIRKYN